MVQDVFDNLAHDDDLEGAIRDSLKRFRRVQVRVEKMDTMLGGEELDVLVLSHESVAVTSLPRAWKSRLKNPFAQPISRTFAGAGDRSRTLSRINRTRCSFSGQKESTNQEFQPNSERRAEIAQSTSASARCGASWSIANAKRP